MVARCRSQLPSGDLEEVLRSTVGLWPELRGARLFFTGATGFFGAWLLESLLEADKRFGLETQSVLLTRDPDKFSRLSPHIARHPSIRLLKGSVVSLEPDGLFDLVIHLATEADTASTLAKPLDAIEVIAEGTRRTLEFARRAGAKKVLFTSSGSVYARGRATEPIDEDFPFATDPTDMDAVYSVSGQAKRHAEALCAAYARQHQLSVSIARCFAFLGPGLPLDGKFAAGNFVLDALAGRPIAIKGDGTPVRSYLYPSDLAVWLWTLLLKGQPGRAYNVGSEHAVTLRELAEQVSRELGASPVTVMGECNPARPADYYVPSTRRARAELGLSEHIDLPTAIRRTADWCRAAS